MAAEARLAEDSPGWTVRILPPAGPLPGLDLPDEAPGAETQPAIEATAWALARRGTNSARLVARRVSGEPAARAQARLDQAADALRARGLVIETVPLRGIDSALERESGLAQARLVEVEPLPPVTPDEDESATEPTATPSAAEG
jgi:hypothetical protein